MLGTAHCWQSQPRQRGVWSSGTSTLMLQVSGELVTLSQQGTSARSLGTALCCQSQALQHSIWSATNTPAQNTPRSSINGVPLLQPRAAAEQRSAEVRSPPQGACSSFVGVQSDAADQPLRTLHRTSGTTFKVHSKLICKEGSSCVLCRQPRHSSRHSSCSVPASKLLMVMASTADNEHCAGRRGAGAGADATAVWLQFRFN